MENIDNVIDSVTPSFVIDFFTNDVGIGQILSVEDKVLVIRKERSSFNSNHFLSHVSSG